MSEPEPNQRSARPDWAAKRKAVQPKVVSVAAPAVATPSERGIATTQDVKRMYEQFPYPSPVVGDSLIKDLSNAVGFLFDGGAMEGWRVLDAGCGTGHRVLALAQDYPGADVTGVDMTEASLGVARGLAAKHAIPNVSFRQANLLDLHLDAKFDLITSTGVIHHLTDPQKGLDNLCAHLSPEGLMLVWLYHPYGEFARLIQRELAMLLWGEERSDYGEGVRIMNELGLNLSTHQYGTETSNPLEGDLSRPSINVDAYLHPIVKAYRFDEAVRMLRDAGADWVSVNGVNLDGRSRLIDLGRTNADPYFTVGEEELFPTPFLLERFRAMSRADRLRAVELRLLPTGFNLVAGKNRSYKRCGARVRSNLLEG